MVVTTSCYLGILGTEVRKVTDEALPFQVPSTRGTVVTDIGQQVKLVVLAALTVIPVMLPSATVKVTVPST